MGCRNICPERSLLVLYFLSERKKAFEPAATNAGLCDKMCIRDSSLPECDAARSNYHMERDGTFPSRSIYFDAFSHLSDGAFEDV